MMKETADILGNWQIFFFLGIAGLFFGCFFLLIGFILLAVAGDSGIWKLFLVLATLALIPGILLMALGVKKRKPLKEIESLAEVLRAYRRIKISKVAQKLGVNEFEAERRIAACIDRGLVQGYIDRNTEEFFTLESIGHVMPVGGCPNCGAPPDRIYLVGEQARCSSCGAVVGR